MTPTKNTGKRPGSNNSVNLSHELSDVVHHRSTVSKSIGALFSQPLRREAHVFHFDKERPTMHTWFFTEPLHIAFLDNDQRVQETHVVNPWDTVRPRTPASYVVELPPSTTVSLEDKVTW